MVEHSFTGCHVSLGELLHALDTRKKPHGIMFKVCHSTRWNALIQTFDHCRCAHVWIWEQKREIEYSLTTVSLEYCELWKVMVFCLHKSGGCCMEKLRFQFCVSYVAHTFLTLSAENSRFLNSTKCNKKTIHGGTVRRVSLYDYSVKQKH